MLEELSALQIWLLVGGAVAVGFFAGRTSVGPDMEARERYRLVAKDAAVHNFELLTSAEQAEVDRLAANGKIVDAVKLVRGALRTGLEEAKEIVDGRRRPPGTNGFP